MNVSGINNNTKRQSFGMKPSGFGQACLEHFDNRGLLSHKIKSALDSLTITPQPNYRLNDLTIGTERGIFIKRRPASITIEDIEDGTEAKINSSLTSLPRVLERLEDDSYVAKLIRKARAEK